ncbi:MAG: hypothetical protein KCHDKBKB_01098 [Elusimicrobia bacterium]|nr:hypothetical protein [Elusimicrobiota bacterium]
MRPSLIKSLLHSSVFHDILKSDPIHLIDVGARAGVQGRWIPLRDHLSVVGFEPDPVECQRLNETAHKNEVFISTALADQKQQRILNLTQSPGCSSMLMPNREFLNRFPKSERYQVEKTVQVSVDTLDHALNSVHVAPDFMKLDVQGAEIEVLRGAEESLDSLLGLEVEVEFAEVYKGQPLFSHIDEFMRSHGFALFDLKRCWWKRAGGENTANHRGQLIFGDALYFKDLFHPRVSGKKISKNQILKFVVIALLYEKNDFVVELLQYALEQGLLTEIEAAKIKRSVLVGSGFLGKLPNIKGRYCLARWFQRFSNAVAPKSWGPSDILW